MFISAFLALAAQSVFTVTNAAYHGPVERPANARLVWSDEFGGSRLDLAKWRYDTAFNKKGWFNRELQYYSVGRPENFHVANGRLMIEARRETLASAPDWGGQNYTSGRIVSKGRGMDLRLLRNSREAALRAGHLAGHLDASDEHEEMARRAARSISWSRSEPNRT